MGDGLGDGLCNFMLFINNFKLSNNILKQLIFNTI